MTSLCTAAAKTGPGLAFSGMIADFEMLHRLVEIRQSHWLRPGSVSRPQRDHESEPENAAGFGRWKTLKLSLTVSEWKWVILNTAERKERTEDEVSDDCGSGLFVPPCWEAFLPNTKKHKAECIVHTCVHTHTHIRIHTIYTGTDGLLHGRTGHRPQRVKGPQNRASVWSDCYSYVLLESLKAQSNVWMF